MEKTTIKIESSFLDEDTITVEITGNSSVPFWHDDLKLKTAIELISTCDWKNIETDKQQETILNLLEELKEVSNHLTNP